MSLKLRHPTLAAGPLLLAALWSCGDDGSGSPTPDAATDPIPDVSADTTDSEEDAGHDVAADTTTADADAGVDIIEDVDRADVPDPRTDISVNPPAPAALRLTREHYAASIRQALGADIVVPTALEPDIVVTGFITIGASSSLVSSRGVEQYETAAYSIARQALGNADTRVARTGCDMATDDACTRSYLSRTGRLLWRRALSAEELDQLTGIAAVAADTLGDAWRGGEFALATLLQSPHFLYRVEVGEPGEGPRPLTQLELATRLSFFLWNAPPDDELLSAAEAGELAGEALEARIESMLADPRAVAGVRNVFNELWGLHKLDRLSLDPTLFVHFAPEVGPAAREETLRGIEHLVFELDGDYRDIFTTQTTFVNRKLASIYGVPAPVREGFGRVEFDADSGRRGLLGQVSMLALHSHPVSTSATLRGQFVRQTLLCGTIDPPPVDVNTALPEPSGTTRTLRERVAEHLEGESCRACHLLMDPIGLGLENFDAIGRWRDTDNDAPIDASGELDGVPFANAWELAGAIRNHPALPACLVRNMYRYATGRVNQLGDREQLTELSTYFEAVDYRILPLMRALALSPGFTTVGAPDIEEVP